MLQTYLYSHKIRIIPKYKVSIMIRKYINKFKEHAGAQRYTKNASWMFFSRMFTLLVSFLTMLYISRVLGPTNFGELDYALAVIGVFGIIGSWGIEGVLNRELIKYPEKHNEIIGTASTLRLILGAVATIIVIIFVVFSNIDQISKILLIILSFTYTISTFSILQQTFLAKAESKYPSIITAIITLVTNIAKVIIIFTGKGIIYLAVIMVVESLLSALLYFLAYTLKLNGKPSEWTFSSTFARLFIKTGGAVAFLGMFAMIYSRIDQIMIRNMLDATAVGLYSAGVRLVDLWGFIPMIIGSALYPAVLNARKNSEYLYLKRLQKLFLLYSLPAIIIAIAVSVCAKPLILFIYGDKFIDGFQALQIYIWSLPGTFIGFFVMNILFTDDHRKVLVLTTAFPAIVNILLNLLWIPIYGIIGAAWATTISYSLIPVIPLLFKQTRAILYTVFKPQQ